MPIKFRHDAAAVVPPSNETTRKYGQSLVSQQRQQNFLGKQQGYDRLFTLGRDQMQNQQLEAGRQQNFMEAARKQSSGMIMDDIENGMYDPVTSNKLRQLLVEESEALSNPHLDATQRAVVLEKYRAARALHTANRMEKPYQPNPDEEFNKGIVTDPKTGMRFRKNSKGDWDQLPEKQNPPTSFGEWAQQPENLAKAQSQLAAKQAEIQRRMELEEGYPALKPGETIQDRALDELETQFGAIQKRYGPKTPASPGTPPPPPPPPPGAANGGAGQPRFSGDIDLGPAHPDYVEPKPDDIVSTLAIDRADGRPVYKTRDGRTVLGEPRDVDAAQQPELALYNQGGLTPQGGGAQEQARRLSLQQGTGAQANQWAGLASQAGQVPPPPPPPGAAPATYMQDENGNYVNTPEEQARLDAEAQQRYLQDQGPSMQRYTGVLNQQADAMSANLAGSQGRINNPVPYGARNVYSPLGGEGELEYQQGLKSGVPSQEELLASNKAQVEGLRGVQATNNAAMQDRDTNKINNPKQMRLDMQSTTDAYNIYKRKGGTMMFRQWAKVYDETNGMTPDVKRQFAQNYPGIWDQQKVDPAGTDINSVASNSGNKAAGKIAKRRAGLLALNGMPPDAPTTAPPTAAAPPVRAGERSILQPSSPMPAAPPTQVPPPTPAMPAAGGIQPATLPGRPQAGPLPTQSKYGAQPAAPQAQKPTIAATGGTQSAAPNFTDLIYKTKDAGKRRVITALQGMYANQPPEVQNAIGVLLNPASDDTAAANALEYLKSAGIDPAQLEVYQHQGGTRKGKNK